MSITRPALSTDRYGIVPNHWVRDQRLTYKAKGLLVAIASHSPGYVLTVRQLVTESADGKDAVSSGLAELERVGYLRRVRTRNDNGTLGAYEYEIVEYPQGRETDPPTPPDDPPPDSDQGGKPVTGSDQAKQGVSAGGDQCGLSTVDNPPTKKYQGEKTKNTNPPGDNALRAPSPGTDVEPAPATNTVLAEFVDHCTRNGVKLPARVKGHYAREIKTALDEGFSSVLVCRALAGMIRDGIANRPSLLPNRIVAEQTGPERRPQKAVRESTTDQRMAQGMAVVERLRALEAGTAGAEVAS